MTGAAQEPCASQRRVLDALRAGPRPAHLARPCTAGDGLAPISPARWPSLEARWEEARSQGRLSAWVPASGAATRMFGGIERLETLSEEALLTSPHPLAQAVRRLEELAVWPLIEASSLRDRLAGLRSLATSPKVLFPFHRDGAARRSPLDEHLEEAAALTRPRGGVGALHLTLSPEHRERVLAAYQRHPLARAVRLRLSVQPPETEVPWLDAHGEPARDPTGALLLRPGGHGALLSLLEGADVLLVKNVDNVLPPALARARSLPWRRRLTGLLLCLEAQAHGWIRYLLDGGTPEPVRRFLGDTLFMPSPRADTAELLRILDRPLRVVGVVPQRGEPGGGPFWLHGVDPEVAARPQIAEGSQVDHTDPDQAAIWRASTHFNPVDMALSLRDHLGRPFALARFSDPDAWLVAEKTLDGQPARIYEHPGLWNGAMARWNTVMVEIGEESFAPVKRLSDLLRPEHL